MSLTPRWRSGSLARVALLAALTACGGGGGGGGGGGPTGNGGGGGGGPAANPMPAISKLLPDLHMQSGSGLVLTVVGTGFVNGSVVRWNGNDRPTTFVSATELSATIADGDLAVVGPAPVTVRSPAPGGGTTPWYPFIITAKEAPTVISLVPATVTAGAPGATITMDGYHYFAETRVFLGGEERPTTVVFPVRLRFTLTAADVATARDLPMKVVTPGPGGGEASFTLRVVAP